MKYFQTKYENNMCNARSIQKQWETLKQHLKKCTG